MTEEFYLLLSEIDLKTTLFEIDVYQKTGLLRHGVVQVIMRECKIIDLDFFIESLLYFENVYSGGYEEVS